MVDLAAPQVVDPYGGAYFDVSKKGKITKKRKNPLGGTSGVVFFDTKLKNWPGMRVPNLSHCKYWPDRDGGKSGNEGIW